MEIGLIVLLSGSMLGLSPAPVDDVGSTADQPISMQITEDGQNPLTAGKTQRRSHRTRAGKGLVPLDGSPHSLWSPAVIGRAQTIINPVPSFFLVLLPFLFLSVNFCFLAELQGLKFYLVFFFLFSFLCP